MVTYEEVLIKIQPNDVLESKSGFLFVSPFGKWYICKKMKYLGDGKWKVIGEKEEVDVNSK